MVEEEIFRPFRPYCAILTNQQNLECLDKLRKLCEASEPSQLEQIQEYLMFPAQLHLKTKAKTSPQNYTVAVLEYISSLYTRIHLSSLFILKDVISSCLALTTVKEKQPTEDLQVWMCSSIRHMTLSCSRGVRSELLSQDMKLTLSHLVFTCLTWTESTDTATSVRMSCLELLQSLCHNPEQDRSLSRHIGTAFSSMLPGKTSTETDCNYLIFFRCY